MAPVKWQDETIKLSRQRVMNEQQCFGISHCSANMPFPNTLKKLKTVVLL
jgi:hypothetical protein